MSTILRALKRVSILCTLALLPAVSFGGFFISNGQLVDDNGTPFVMRGVNYPYTWYSCAARRRQQDLANIAATGANTVRYVLSTGGQWARIPGAQVSQVIQWAKDNRMISVLEVHDSTGWSEGSGSVNISNAVPVLDQLRHPRGDQRPGKLRDHQHRERAFRQQHHGATTFSRRPMPSSALRTAGHHAHDHDRRGQLGPGLVQHDAQQRHEAVERGYAAQPAVQRAHVRGVRAGQHHQLVHAGLRRHGPAAGHRRIRPDHNGQIVDAATIMAQAQQRGNGYIGWSWSGNGGCCTVPRHGEQFRARAHDLGQSLVNGTNGIRATSVPASVFGPVGNNLTVSPTSLTFGSAPHRRP